MEETMTNGEMPSGEMMQSHDRSASPTSSTKPDLTEAIQALEKLNSQELTILRQIVSSLDQSRSISGVLSAAEAGSLGTSSIGVQSVGDGALRGMDAAKQVQNLGFVEFTAGLINGTFDAIIGATVKQMEAYAKLVADLSKSIKQFQIENVSDAQIGQHLAERYPDGQGGTSVRPGYTFADIPANEETGAAPKRGDEQLSSVVQALITETRSLVGQNLNLTLDKLNISPGDTSFDTTQVQKIRESIGALLATNMVEQLRQMARDGMARIVITEGEIMTKLTFNITTNELQEKQKQNYNQNINRTQIGGGAGGLWWKVKASTDNTNINVNSMNEKSFDQTTMSTEMIGQVKVRFKTESFPPYVPPTDVSEPGGSKDNG
jgi:hypothetical protein